MPLQPGLVLPRVLVQLQELVLQELVLRELQELVLRELLQEQAWQRELQELPVQQAPEPLLLVDWFARKQTPGAACRALALSAQPKLFFETSKSIPFC